MRIATLLHNPGAGDEEHDRETLVRLIESGGYTCHYVPVKETGLDSIEPDTEFIIIAGGDGTVRKVAKQLLLSKDVNSRIPLTILPMGTANNIARNLGYGSGIENIISSWPKMRTQSIDIWNIENLPGARFFAEGMGFGVFPELIKEMEDYKDVASPDPRQRLKTALSKLVDICNSYKPSFCNIIADGHDYSGEYFLVELMNISSIGPNLHLAANANPADRTLELVLLKQEQKQSFINYITGKINGSVTPYNSATVSGSDFSIQWAGDLVHVDDELIELKEAKEIKISCKGKTLNFLVP